MSSLEDSLPNNVPLFDITTLPGSLGLGVMGGICASALIGTGVFMYTNRRNQPEQEAPNTSAAVVGGIASLGISALLGMVTGMLSLVGTVPASVVGTAVYRGIEESVPSVPTRIAIAGGAVAGTALLTGAAFYCASGRTRPPATRQ